MEILQIFVVLKEYYELWQDILLSMVHNDGLQDQAILPSGMLAYPSWFPWLLKSSKLIEEQILDTP